MGEYLYLRGSKESVCKLGVMDDFRYIRHDEAERLAPHEGEGDGGTLAHSLADASTLWRFPFPWEDQDLTRSAQEIAAEIAKREMSRTTYVEAPMTVVRAMEHADKVVHMTPRGGGWGVNVWVPCPHSAAGLKLHQSTGGASPILVVHGERHERGEARTIFACGYCEKLYSFTPNEITEFGATVATEQGGRAIEARLRGRVQVQSV